MKTAEDYLVSVIPRVETILKNIEDRCSPDQKGIFHHSDERILSLSNIYDKLMWANDLLPMYNDETPELRVINAKGYIIIYKMMIRIHLLQNADNEIETVEDAIAAFEQTIARYS